MRGADGLQEFDYGNRPRREIMSLAIRESLLGRLPDSLVGVELRRVGREALQVGSLAAGAKLRHELALMGSSAVPQDDDVTRQFAQQAAQNVAVLALPDVLHMELTVKVETLPAWGNRDPRDG